jgi:hypothetical protein
VATAKLIVPAAAHWDTFDRGFLNSTTPDNAKSFLKKMAAMALEYGDDGQPKVDANGKYVYHPAFPFLLNHIGNNRVEFLRQEFQRSGKFEGPAGEFFHDGLKVLEAQAAKLGGDEGEALQAAVDLIRARVPAIAQPQVEEPEDVKQARASVKAQQDALSRQQGEQRQVAHQQAVDRSETKAADSLKEQLKPLLQRFGLQGQILKDAEAKIGERLEAALDAHPYYQAIYNGIEARLQSEQDAAKREAIEKELTAHILLYASQQLPRIATEVGREYAAPVVAAQPATEQKRADQIAQSRTEPRGASISTSPGRATNPGELRMQVKKEWAAKTGNQPDDMPLDELMREVTKRSGVFRTA